MEKDGVNSELDWYMDKICYMDILVGMKGIKLGKSWILSFLLWWKNNFCW